MNIIIPDASVILKWAFKGPDEPAQDKAELLLKRWLANEVEMTLPSLWVYEVGNVLGQKNPAQADAFIKCFLDYEIPEFPIVPALCSRVFDLMGRYQTTFYDGASHALAIEKKGIYLTADQRYFSRTRKEGHIAYLPEWE